MGTDPGVRRRTLSEDDKEALADPKLADDWYLLLAAVEQIGNRWVAEAREQIAQQIEALPAYVNGYLCPGSTMRHFAANIARTGEPRTNTSGDELMEQYEQAGQASAQRAIDAMQRAAEYDDNRIEGGNE